MAASNDTYRDRLGSRILDRATGNPTLFAFPCMALGSLLERHLPASISWTAVIISIVTMYLLLLWINCITPKLQTMMLIFVMMSLAAWRSHSQRIIIEHDQLHHIVGERWNPTVIQAIVDDAPRWRPSSIPVHQAKLDGLSEVANPAEEDRAWQTTYLLRVVSIRNGKTWHLGEYGKTLLTTPGRIRNFLPGDQLTCMVDWCVIPTPTNPGQFDYASKRANEGVFVQAKADDSTQLQFMKVAEPLRFDRPLARIVIAGDTAFHRYVGFGQARLASALVIGQREQVDAPLQEALLATGTIHLLAISGMHIEMVAVSIVPLCVLIGFSRRWTLSVTMVIVVTYALLCGGNPPVARAAILVVCVSLARWVGRPVSTFNILGLSAIIVLLNRPSDLWDVGTQLSFLAVAILILLNRPAHKDPSGKDEEGADALQELIIARSRSMWQMIWYLRKWAWTMLASSAWVWLLTAPIIAHHFHVISPIAILLNLVLWAPLFLALLSGLVVLAIGPWLPWIGTCAGLLCGSSLWLTDQIVRYSQAIPGGHLWLPGPSAESIIVYYASIIVLIVVLGFRPLTKNGVKWPTIIWLLVMVLNTIDQKYGPTMYWNQKEDRNTLEIIFIDVGHGTSVLMRTPEGENWIYDAGRMGNIHSSCIAIDGVLWSQRISRIDQLYISHADSDHYSAIPGLAKRFAIGRLITTRHALSSTRNSIQQVFSQLKRQGVPLTTSQAGDQPSREVPEGSQVSAGSAVQSDSHRTSSSAEASNIPSNHFEARVLHPSSQFEASTDNASSLCLKLRFGGRQLLLPGDLEREGTKQLIGQLTGKIDIMMAPHHGSLSQSPESILAWCRPDLVIISGSHRARDARVLAAYSERSRQVLVTSIHHALRVIIARSGSIQVFRWQHPHWQTILEVPPLPAPPNH